MNRLILILLFLVPACTNAVSSPGAPYCQGFETSATCEEGVPVCDGGSVTVIDEEGHCVVHTNAPTCETGEVVCVNGIQAQCITVPITALCAAARADPACARPPCLLAWQLGG